MTDTADSKLQEREYGFDTPAPCSRLRDGFEDVLDILADQALNGV